MRVAVSLLLLMCLALPAAAGVKVDHEPGVDFSQFRTFAWKHGTDAARPDVQRWVLAAVEREMKAAGLRLVHDRRADIYVVTHAFADREVGQSAAYGQSIRYDVGVLVSDVVMKTKGVLAIDMMVGESERPVWRAVVSELMQEEMKPDKLQKKIDKFVKKMFKDFPPDSAR
jgi:hypothetical protein